MREIRFRAWDKRNKKMWLPNDYGFGYDSYSIIITPNGQLIDIMCDRDDDYTDELILMQFTGFKDNKGVDIYEGDIYSWRGLHYPKDPRIVKWELVDNCDESFSGYGFTKRDCKSFAVIGNIYENPELLEVKK